MNYFNGLSDDELDLALQTRGGIPPQVLALLFTRASISLKAKKASFDNNFGKMPVISPRFIFNARLSELERRRRERKEDRSLFSADALLFCYMAAINSFNAAAEQAAAEDCCAEGEEESTSALKTRFSAASTNETGAMAKALAALIALQSRSAALLQNSLKITKTPLSGFSTLITA